MSETLKPYTVTSEFAEKNVRTLRLINAFLIILQMRIYYLYLINGMLSFFILYIGK